MELLEALTETGCPICFLAARSTSRHIETYCRDSVTDVPVRDRIRAANGYCTRHAHEFLEKQDALAAAITYSDVLKKLIALADQLANRAKSPSITGRLRRLFKKPGPTGDTFLPTSQCPACKEQALAEQRYVTGLVAHLGEQSVREAFKASRGLCLVHLPNAMTLAQDDQLLILIGVQIAAWTELKDHMNEVVRKADYRFMSEGITDDEKSSLLDVINRVAGERGIR